MLRGQSPGTGTPPLRPIFSVFCLIAPLAAFLTVSGRAAHAQSPTIPAPRAMITQAIDASQRLTLAGNTRPEANAANDRGPVANSFALPHMLLQLKRSPELEQALDQLIDQMHDRNSPNYHKWLTPAQFGARFGAAPADVQKITGWLQAQGFTVNSVYPNNLLIDFSGNAEQVAAAFHTQIHNLAVKGAAHFANMSDPQIPIALAPVVTGIVSLHDFRPKALHVPKARAQDTAGNGNFLVAPADLATIYNINPLFSAGITGLGQTVVVVEDTDLFNNGTADWTTFRSVLGLSGYTQASLTTQHPNAGNNCFDPGVNGDDEEAALDVEWASAAAPNAAIVMASCANTATFGGLIAIENLLNAPNPPAIISVSYGECETENGATQNAAFNSTYQQGVSEGVSIFVSTGDSDASVCDRNEQQTPVTHGISVNGFGSTSYNVAVGGTDFGDTFAGTTSLYWNASNSAIFGSALSYVPEIPWNDTCASQLIATFIGQSTTFGSSGSCNTGQWSFFLEPVGGSGGPSACATGTPTSVAVSGTCQGWAKPSWQQGIAGNPNDGVRDLPDVALFAADGVWGHYYVFCYSDPNHGGVPCTGAPSNWSGAGGTSFASPIMAGIQALVNQYTGESQGNSNVRYYQLAAAQYGPSGNSSCNSTQGAATDTSCIFYDITQGDNDSACTGGVNCFLPSGSVGVLSTSDSSFAPAYTATPGWDFATGIGSVNAYNLVMGWNSGGAATDQLSVALSGDGSVTSAPAGISCGTNCATAFIDGAQVSLTAIPAAGWNFGGWSGGCTGTAECSLVMFASTSVTATFTPSNSFLLSVVPSGSGTVTSTDSAINCGSTCSSAYGTGTVVTLNATPAAGSGFLGWGPPCSGTGPCQVTMNNAVSVSASFGPMSGAGGGGGTATRTFVSGSGSDTNPCSRTAPCRSFAQAITQTAPAGEIDVLDSAGYGAVTITKAISIVNDGVGTSSILVPSGSVGITINAGVADAVSLRGLTIDGEGVGGTGILFNSGQSLTVERNVIRHVTGDAIGFMPSAGGNVLVSSTLIADNGGYGIEVFPTGSGQVTGVFNRVETNNNAFAGIIVNGTSSTGTISASVAESVASHNGYAGYAAFSSSGQAPTNLMLFRSVSANNGSGGSGIIADGAGATVRVGRSAISGNTNGWQVVPTGALLSYTDNNIDGNATNETAPSTTPRK